MLPEMEMGDSQSRPYSDVNLIKKNLTLDLRPPHDFNTRQMNMETQTNSSVPLPSSPDLQTLLLRTPEIENLIIEPKDWSNHILSPDTAQFFFPETVTEEQRRYAKGFEDALNELHCLDYGRRKMEAGDAGINNRVAASENFDSWRVNNNFMPPLLPTHDQGSSPGVTAESLTFQNASESSGWFPIDVQNQELIKLERKRMKNRVAASKCRRKKLEKIARLERKVKLLNAETDDLSSFLVDLRNRVQYLKDQVLEHINNGCQFVGHS